MNTFNKQTPLIKNKLVLSMLFIGFIVPLLIMLGDTILFVFGIIIPVNYIIAMFAISWTVAILLCVYIIVNVLFHQNF